MGAPTLYFSDILAWADDFHERTGKWPKKTSGRIVGRLGDTWLAVDLALRRGSRGLPGGSSLPQLLAERRGVRNHRRLPPFMVEQILAWADTHRARVGSWPLHDSGPIGCAPGETWLAVDHALRRGSRGLRGRSSLARLLAKYRGVRNTAALPQLTIPQILAWADAHHQRTGSWPKANSGPIADAPGEIWGNVHSSLGLGNRGLPGGTSLARLLARHRGVRNRKGTAKMTIAKILAWADAHHARTGQYPGHKSGPIADAPGETWLAVESALRLGCRGLPGVSSLHTLLMQHGRKTRRLPRSYPKPVGGRA